MQGATSAVWRATQTRSNAGSAPGRAAKMGYSFLEIT